MAKAKPLNVIILMVCPNNFKNNTALKIAIGIVIITTTLLLQSCKNNNTINPVKIAPRMPSVIKLFAEFITKTD